MDLSHNYSQLERESQAYENIQKPTPPTLFSIKYYHPLNIDHYTSTLALFSMISHEPEVWCHRTSPEICIGQWSCDTVMWSGINTETCLYACNVYLRLRRRAVAGSGEAPETLIPRFVFMSVTIACLCGPVPGRWDGHVFSTSWWVGGGGGVTCIIWVPICGDGT